MPAKAKPLRAPPPPRQKRGEPFSPEALDRFEKAIAKGIMDIDEWSPCPKFDPLKKPGVTISGLILEDRCVE